MCETKWIKRHSSVIQFKNEIENIADAPTEISTWNEQLLASKARVLLCTLREIMNFHLRFIIN